MCKIIQTTTSRMTRRAVTLPELFGFPRMGPTMDAVYEGHQAIMLSVSRFITMDLSSKVNHSQSERPESVPCGVEDAAQS